MQRPDVKFFVPGFSKCGTTTFCSLLGDHPEIFIPECKEPNFFAMAYRRGWDWYNGLFEGSGNRICGEGSTFYTAANFETQVVNHIKENYPKAKFIFIARDPLKRIESSYREHHHSGHKYGVHVPHDLEQTLRDFPNIIDDTSYWSRLNAYRNHFDDDRFHILFFEDLITDWQGELAKCFEFLGVDPTIEIQDLERQLNPGSRKRYDTKLMRFIRQNQVASTVWGKLPKRRQEKLESRNFLRKPFVNSIEWSRSAREYMLDQLYEDAASFLQFAGKPADYWQLESCVNDRANASLQKAA